MFKGIPIFLPACLLIFLPLLTAISGCSAGGQKSGSTPSTAASDLLSGDWDVNFEMGGNAFAGHMTLKQDGTQFFGEGMDANNVPFTIVNGQINGDQLDFFKKYPGNPPSAIVTYHGTISMVDEPDYHGPYLTGTYSVESGSNRASGNWRAQMPAKLKGPATAIANEHPTQTVPTSASNTVAGTASTDGTSGTAGLQPPAASGSQSTPPELTGKWNAAYEYNFGIVHSVMFLKQNKQAIAGHGVDTVTSEKFVIQKGWYKYPQLVLVRSYSKKQGAKSDRTNIFKATVSTVDDPDYQGPYLSGKTQGGGSWEAQLAK